MREWLHEASCCRPHHLPDDLRARGMLSASVPDVVEEVASRLVVVEIDSRQKVSPTLAALHAALHGLCLRMSERHGVQLHGRALVRKGASRRLTLPFVGLHRPRRFHDQT